MASVYSASRPEKIKIAMGRHALQKRTRLSTLCKSALVYMASVYSAVSHEIFKYVIRRHALQKRASLSVLRKIHKYFTFNLILEPSIYNTFDGN